MNSRVEFEEEDGKLLLHSIEIIAKIMHSVVRTSRQFGKVFDIA